MVGLGLGLGLGLVVVVRVRVRVEFVGQYPLQVQYNRHISVV